MPRRIQRRRTAGWTTPPNTTYVGRPTRWGNPYQIGDRMPASAAVARYREDLHAGRLQVTADEVRRELRGRNLSCWCAVDALCHASVLLAVANDGPL